MRRGEVSCARGPGPHVDADRDVVGLRESEIGLHAWVVGGDAGILRGNLAQRLHFAFGVEPAQIFNRREGAAAAEADARKYVAIPMTAIVIHHLRWAAGKGQHIVPFQLGDATIAQSIRVGRR